MHLRTLSAPVSGIGALLVTMLMAGAVHAQSSEQSPLRINGFGTLGVASSAAPDGWRFRRDAAQYPQARSTTFDTDSRLGLQAHYELDPKLELASQVVLKRRLPGAKPLDSVEWLFASYRPTGNLTVRVGRTNPDLFLLSDYRNVGVAYPWVRPNTDFYAALPLYTTEGMDAAYVWNQDDTRWRLKAFAGQANARATVANSPDPIIFKMKSALGVILTRERDGLLLRGTIAGARLSAKGSDQTYQLASALHGLQSWPDPAIASAARALEDRLGLNPDTAIFSELGVSYDHDGWMWSAEYSQVNVETGTRSAQSAYASVGRRFGDLTIYGLTGRTLSRMGLQATPDWSALGASTQYVGQVAAQGINGMRVRQSSLSLGLRWDFHPQMALKLQWDHYWVGEYGSGLWVGGNGQAVQPHVGTATLDFVF